MQTKLIAISKPCIPECSTAEELVAYCARVSNPGNQANHDTAAKLLRYLIKHKHYSPFEMVSLTIEIQTTRDIGRQILRHRSFSFQEFSQRYAVAMNFEHREARMQDSKNRQASHATDDEELQKMWEDYQQNVVITSQAAYDWALDNGIAKEQARAVLPEGMTQSTMYMTGTARSWYHYIQLRSGIETQKEHREIALACKDIFISQFPALAEVLFENAS